jgi:Integrase core domain
MKPNPQTTFQFIGKLDGDRIRGSALMVEPKISFIWEASRESARSSSPQTHTFEPTQFQHFFADSIAPVRENRPAPAPQPSTVSGAARWASEVLQLCCMSFLTKRGPRSDLREGFRPLGEGHGHPTSLPAPRSPWQRAYVERVIGTIRRECPNSHDRFRRGQLVSTSSKLHQLLSPEPDALGIGEGQPGAPAGPTARPWTDHRDSGGGWAPSSLRAARRLNGILSPYQQRPSLLRQTLSPTRMATYRVPSGSAISREDHHSLGSASARIGANRRCANSRERQWNSGVAASQHSVTGKVERQGQ